VWLKDNYPEIWPIASIKPYVSKRIEVGAVEPLGESIPNDHKERFIKEIAPYLGDEYEDCYQTANISCCLEQKQHSVFAVNPTSKNLVMLGSNNNRFTLVAINHGISTQVFVNDLKTKVSTGLVGHLTLKNHFHAHIHGHNTTAMDLQPGDMIAAMPDRQDLHLKKREWNVGWWLINSYSDDRFLKLKQQLEGILEKVNPTLSSPPIEPIQEGQIEVVDLDECIEESAPSALPTNSMPSLKPMFLGSMLEESPYDLVMERGPEQFAAILNEYIDPKDLTVRGIKISGAGHACAIRCLSYIFNITEIIASEAFSDLKSKLDGTVDPYDLFVACSARKKNVWVLSIKEGFCKYVNNFEKPKHVVLFDRAL